MTHDELTAQLAGTDPYADAPPDPDRVAGLSLALAREVVAAQPRRGSSRLSTRKLAAFGVAALVVVPTGAWAADRFHAQTGEFGAPGMTEEDTSEWIDPCATDFPTYVRSLPLPSGLTLPTGRTWADMVDGAVENIARSTASDCGPGELGATMQETGIRSNVIEHLQGEWACIAVAAAEAGDDAAVREAGLRIAETYDAQASLGVFGDETWRTLRDQAHRGDLSYEIDQALAYGSCQ